LRSAGAALAFILVLPAAGMAAPPSKTSKAAARPSAPAPEPERLDLFAGYSYLHSGSASLHGLSASVSYPVWRNVRVVGDLGMQFGNFAGADLSEYELLVGARRYWTVDRFRPFAELLTGVAHHSESFTAPDATLESGGTDFAIGPSVGADYRLTGAWRARLGVALLFVHGGGWETDPRLSVGVVYTFGSGRP
jgi:hypothetical protein